MSPTSVLFINYSDEEHSLQFNENIVNFGYHTDIYDELKIKLNTKIIALISTENGYITYFAIGNKSNKVASKKRRFKFTEVAEAAEPIEIKQLINNKDKKIANYWKKIIRTDHLSIVVPSVWNNFFMHLREEHEKNYIIFKMILDKLIKGKNDNTREKEIVAFENDALKLSLKVTGYDNYIKQNELHNYYENSASDILRSIDKILVREDLMIMNDSSFIKGFKIKEQNMVSKTLSDGRTRITIIYANRMPLEETLGVDLIYLNESTKSTVMVQYKRLTGNPEKNYRPSSDENFNKEYNRMKTIDEKLLYHHTSCYRYNDEVFYFKFCKDIQTTLNRDLIDGMYVTYRHLKNLLDNKQLKGKRGGSIINYNRIPNHLNNTLFISLLKTGLIGSNEKSYDIISEVIKEVLIDGKSILFTKYENLAV